jgi:hypothetical protein
MCDYSSHYEKQFTQLLLVFVASFPAQHPRRKALKAIYKIYTSLTSVGGEIISRATITPARSFPMENCFSAVLCLNYDLVQFNISRNNCIIYTYSSSSSSPGKSPESCKRKANAPSKIVVFSSRAGFNKRN